MSSRSVGAGRCRLALLLVVLLQLHQSSGSGYLNILNTGNIVNSLRNMYGGGGGAGNGFQSGSTYTSNGNGGYSYTYPISSSGSFGSGGNHNGGGNYVATISPPTIVYNNGAQPVSG